MQFDFNPILSEFYTSSFYITKFYDYYYGYFMVLG